MKKKKKSNLWLKLLSFLFFLIVMVLIYFVIHTVIQQYNKPVDETFEIMISSTRPITQLNDVNEALDPLFNNIDSNVDTLDSIRLKLLSLPWIKSVMVKKEWPNRYIIHIDEYSPHYRWHDFLYIDAEGTVFSIPEYRIQNEDIIRLYGVEGKERENIQYLDYFDELTRNDAYQNKIKFSIIAAEVNQRGAWQLVMQYCVRQSCSKAYNLKVILGKDKVIERFKRLVYYFPDLMSKIDLKEQITEVDLRNDNGIIIKKQMIDE